MLTVFVGDIHGCARELEQLLRKVDFRTGSDRLLLTGDAFSRGPDPAVVWEWIVETDAKMVLGNHDARQLRHLEALAEGRDIRFGRPDQKVTLERLAPWSDDLLPWLRSVPLYIAAEDFLLVHAGINPERGLADTSRDEFLTIRTWPPTGGTEGPRWHDALEDSGDGPIVFGHDAPGGLVVKPTGSAAGAASRRPAVLGLDSGCVYGGSLTAYVLEENRLVDVDSAVQPG